jgi:signal transduction histidine kinase
MRLLLYLRLTYLTAGTLLAFFWLVVILGHRRQRNFERIFFFLCLALVSFFGCSLLWVNAQLFYGDVTGGLRDFAWWFLCLGLWFVPALVLHLHVEYASLRALIRSAAEKRVWLIASYLPGVVLVPKLAGALRSASSGDFERPSYALGGGFQAWLAASLVSAAWWQWSFAKTAPNQEQKRFHTTIEYILAGICALFLAIVALQRAHDGGTPWISSLLMILALVPFGILIGNVQRFNFLQIGRQRNLIYAVFVTFLALLYLSLVRRASLWLEAYLPPEATAALLLFLPVALFEPLQRTMRRLLQQTAQKELDHAHKLIGPINEAARLGDMAELTAFTEKWIADELQLAEVKIELGSDGAGRQSQFVRNSLDVFEIRRGGEALGTLRVTPHGAMISGETYTALELVCEQLPAAFDLCRSIDDKLQLERELAERDRLALVGQMAASVSHNLKNPLGSIKTILQVQLENPELPVAMRQETQMVLDEIGRLSAKLNQLLQFSRPRVRGGSTAGQCDLAQVTEQVVGVFRHEADAKNVALKLGSIPGNCLVAAGAEVVNDILSNVLLNAIEAADRGGHVWVALQPGEKYCQVDIVDDGPGIPTALHEKIQQPFFTTKARGTGLGLAIVQRRLEEVAGRLEVTSPLENGRGTRFRILLRSVLSASNEQVSQ